ncbi:MAG TPA: hypothetical protein PLK31_19730, partial [Chloroflexota bacterium]|nr:hypothetical protein [Chloroflexota bacterium]
SSRRQPARRGNCRPAFVVGDLSPSDGDKSPTTNPIGDMNMKGKRVLQPIIIVLLIVVGFVGGSGYGRPSYLPMVTKS